MLCEVSALGTAMPRHTQRRDEMPFALEVGSSAAAAAAAAGMLLGDRKAKGERSRRLILLEPSPNPTWRVWERGRG